MNLGLYLFKYNRNVSFSVQIDKMIAQRHQKIRISRRLAFRQAKWTVLIAFLLGLVISLIQIYEDYSEEKQSLHLTIRQVLRVIEQPASQAAYSLDKAYAMELIMGLFEYDPIYHAAILDDAGREIASFQRKKAEAKYHRLTDQLFGENQSFRVLLNIQPPPTSFAEMNTIIKVGEIQVFVDTYPVVISFLSRSLRIFLFGILRNFLLAFILLFFFHHYLTRPLLKIQNDLRQINPEKPEEKRLQCPPNHLEDEFGAMITSANTLLETIEEVLRTRIERIRETERLKGEITERKKREEELKKYHEQLEHSNIELKRILEDLQQTQGQLIQSEKMAALGALVAGVAHEINTPVGIAVTTASYLKEEAKKIAALYEKEQISKGEFEAFLSNANEATTMVLNNLQRASELVKSFKQVAVDQTSEEKRSFQLKEYVEEILNSLHPQIKRAGVKIAVNCNEIIELNNYPGAIAQIFTNLIINALMHAFHDKKNGLITIDAESENGKVYLKISDNGNGIPLEFREKIFDPFFTTARNKGGTGLGLHIVYNIVTQKLHGTIECESETNKGTIFHLRFLRKL